MMHVGMDILLMAFDDVLTSTLQSKSINFGSETVGKEIEKGFKQHKRSEEKEYSKTDMTLPI